jgi:G3E family GTPase
MALIPATILTGFLGAGKTTLLKRILTEAHGQKIAVIENEFGEENIDSDILVSDTQEQIIQMSNGCVCCTIREDLRTTLQELAEKKRKGELNFDRVVIETTGLADPGPVAQTFFMDDEVAESYLLDAILTLVDAKHAPEQLNERQEARRQVGFADQIFISKSDLVSADALSALTHRLKHMNPRAPQHIAHFGHMDIKNVLDLHGFNLNATLDIDPEFLSPADHGHDHGHAGHDHGHDHDHGPDCDHPSHGGAQAHGHHHHVDGPRMLRYKGVLYMQGSDRKVIFQGVHQLMGSDLGPLWAANERKSSKLVFIGIDLPKDILLQGMEQALV